MRNYDDIFNEDDGELAPQCRYRKEYCQQLVEWMEKGGSYDAFASKINVNPDTMYHWEEMGIPNWIKAKKLAWSANLAFMEQLGTAAMMGKIKNFSNAVWIFTMKNRHAKLYKDRSEVSVTKLGENITDEEAAGAYASMIEREE